MKKIFSLTLIFTLSITTYSQSFDSAIAYLNFVGEQQENISKKMWGYTKAIAHSKSDKNIENKRQNLLKTLERVIGKIKKTPGYDGDQFKTQLLRRLQFNKNLLNDDYAKIIDMKAVAEQSYDAMEAYMLAQELADKKMEEIQQEYESNFNSYATKHNINIIENESDLSKKMESSNTVFKYYKKMYLIYFKVYINETYLMDALNRNDVSAIQQSANALSESAKEGLEILKVESPFKKDKSIITSTQKVFDLFTDEAKNKVPIMVDFLVLSEDFESITKTLEKTPKRKRSKKQIDDYNKKVNSLNKGVKNFNKVNTDLNIKRKKALNHLNLTNKNFLSKHIPKD